MRVCFFMSWVRLRVVVVLVVNVGVRRGASRANPQLPLVCDRSNRRSKRSPLKVLFLKLQLELLLLPPTRQSNNLCYILYLSAFKLKHYFILVP